MADQLQQAKVVVRDFVLEMRAGRRMQVLLPTGQLKSTTVSLNRELSVLRIARTNQVRRIALKDISGIFPGVGAGRYRWLENTFGRLVCNSGREA